MTNNQLNRERLEKIKSWRETYGAGSNVMLPAEEAEELACIALAAMDSEPVAEVLSNRSGNDTSTIDRALPVGTQLYRHAQPAPEAMPECFRNAVSALESLYRNGQKQCWHERYTADMAYASGVLNACRAAMLQTMSLTGNSPVITDEGGLPS